MAHGDEDSPYRSKPTYRWEYKMWSLGYGRGALERNMQKINGLGELGWEVVSLTCDTQGAFFVMMKRPKQ